MVSLPCEQLVSPTPNESVGEPNCSQGRLSYSLLVEFYLNTNANAAI